MGAHWYFDFVSPFSYLHWQKVRPLVEAGRVEAVPIVFGAVLHALGILGPAEIPKKREFIYRQALWQARRDGAGIFGRNVESTVADARPDDGFGMANEMQDHAGPASGPWRKTEPVGRFRRWP